MTNSEDRRSASSEYERIAQAAAKQAVKQSMEMLFGVDVGSRDDVRELQEDLRRIRRLRKVGDRVGVAALIAATTLVVSGAASFFWDAIKHSVRQ